MGPSGTSGTTTGGPSAHDAAFADMIEGLKNEAVNRGATSLMDEEVTVSWEAVFFDVVVEEIEA